MPAQQFDWPHDLDISVRVRTGDWGAWTVIRSLVVEEATQADRDRIIDALTDMGRDVAKVRSPEIAAGTAATA
jgi:hypothetical protein